MNRRITIAVVVLGLALGPAAVTTVLAGVTGTAVDDSYPPDGQVLYEDNQLVVAAPGVLSNDGPAEYPNRCVDLSTVNDDSLQGDLTINANGSFEFTPIDNFNGSTFFTYKMGISQGSGCPEGGPSNDGTVTITVSKVNDPPYVSTDQCAVDIEVAEDSGPFNSAPHCVEILDYGPTNDENNQNFSEWVVSTNKAELFSVQPTITLVEGRYGALTFTPAENANGQATVSVRARDTGGTANGGDDLSTKVEFKIRITAVNDAPTANADSFQALPDRTLNVRKPGVLSNDSDIDDDALTASKVSDPAHGTVNLGSDGAFSYTPAAGYLGPDSFSYRASDGTVDSATRVVSINVTAISTPMPTAVPPTVAPSAGASAEATVEPPPSGSIEPSASIDPSSSPGASAAATTLASLEPGATPAPEPAAGSGGPSIPVLVVVLLLLSMLTFGAAMYVPKWLERRRGVGPS